jgi:hypothetical protein
MGGGHARSHLERAYVDRSTDVSGSEPPLVLVQADTVVTRVDCRTSRSQGVCEGRTAIVL